MVGEHSGVILEPLARLIKGHSNNFHLSICGLSLSAEDKENPDTPFDDLLPAIGRFSERRIESLNSITKKNSGFIATVKNIVISKFPKIVQIGKYLKFRNEAGAIAEDYDLIHVHGMFERPLLEWLVRDTKIPFVISCWGSDVFRIADPSMIALQQKALRKARAITVSGIEFREVLLSKYGRDLFCKVHFTFFDQDIRDLPEKDRTVAKSSFFNRHSIPEGQIIVGVGHNGHQNNQHLDLINSLECLSMDQRAEITVVLQATYGAKVGYIEALESRLKEMAISVCTLRSFLTVEELQELRLSTDILLYAPISDAFSSSVSQALAAGNIVILGSWLPYKARVRAGFRYLEIDKTLDAGIELKKVLSVLEHERSECVANRELSQSFFSSERLGNLWCSVYDLALDSSP